MCEGNKKQMTLTFVVMKPFIVYLRVAVLFSASDIMRGVCCLSIFGSVQRLLFSGVQILIVYNFFVLVKNYNFY